MKTDRPMEVVKTQIKQLQKSNANADLFEFKENDLRICMVSR